MPTRLLIVALAAGLLGFALFVLLPSAAERDAPSEREAYEAMLAEHPYNNRPPTSEEDLEGMDKEDRPDLAAEQNYLLTMDPATGLVPIEHLFEANRQATVYKRAAGGPLATEAWQERGPNNVGGRTRALMFDPNDADSKKVWAGGVGGGLWFTDDITDEDAEWTPVNDFWANIAISAIAYDATDTDVFYVATGEGWFNADAIRGGGIFKSEDGGETWEQLAATTDALFQNIQDLVVHPTTGDVYATTREGGLQRSQDGGETWTKVLGAGVGSSDNRTADLEIGADGTLYATVGIFSQGAVYKSSTGDAGDWEEISANPGFPTTGYFRVDVATAPSDADVLYAVTHDVNTNGSGGIYRSDDKGETWTEVAEPRDADPGVDDPSDPDIDFTRGQAWYDLIIEVDPNDPNTLFAGGVDLFKSNTGGTTWEQISHWYNGFGEPYVHADQHAIVFKPGSSDEAVFSHDGGVTYTADATALQPTWIDRNNGYNVTQFYSGAIHPEEGSNVMLAGAQDNGTQRFSTEGIGATLEANGGDGGFTFIDQTQSVIAIASTVFNNFSRSANGGFTFPTTLLNQNSGSFINPADYDDREDILFTNINASSLFRVTGVATATPVASTITGSFFATPTHLRVSPFAPDSTSTLFVGTAAGRIFKITDAHGTPDVQPLNTNVFGAGSISSIEFGADENHLLVTLSNYNTVSVWESTNGGGRWTNREGDLPNMPVRWALFNPNDRTQVIIATEAGVWETTNFNAGSPTWTPAPGFPTTRVDMLQTRESDNVVMAATHGRGVFTATFQMMPVSAEEDAAVAGTHTLDAAYPNPFADRASFSLRIAQPQNVRVEVFSTLGKHVAILHDGPLAAETPQRFTIDGTGLASGTYLYVVTGERFRDEGRVTLVR